MNKLAKVVASFGALALIAVPAMPVGATEGSVYVGSFDEFKTQISNNEISTINLTANITMPHKFTLVMGEGEYVADDQVFRTGSVTINGNGHEITMDGGTVDDWKSDFFQIYDKTGENGTVTINDVKFTGDGRDLSLYINGSKVMLGGTVELSGEYGGIGLSAGRDVTGAPSLSFNEGTKITYANEGKDTPKGQSAPVIYTEADDASVKYDGINAAVSSTDDKGDSQTFLYFNKENAPTESADGYTYENLNVDNFRVNPIESETPGEEEKPETPEEDKPNTEIPGEPTEPGQDTETEPEAPTTDDEADITAPNTGTSVANAVLVIVGAIVAVLTAVYAAHFADAKK